MSLSSIAIALCLSGAPDGQGAPKSTASEMALEIQSDFQKQLKAYRVAFDAARAAEQRSKVPSSRAILAESAARRQELATKFPDSPEAFRATVWIAVNCPEGKPGKASIAKLIETKMMGRPPTEIIQGFNAARTFFHDNCCELAEACFQSCLAHPADAETGRLLASVCIESRMLAGDRVPKLFREAADLILRKYVTDDGISHFCESLYHYGVPAWAVEFTEHLNRIVEKNKYSTVRFTSRYALCEMELASGGEHQKTAAKLFEVYAKDFEAESKEFSIAMSLVEEAKDHSERLKTCAIGMVAPAFAGTDLNGNKIAIDDYRGKVVVLVFWASYCGPCMKDVPHELGWLTKFKDRPFAIVGVNCDEDLNEAKLAVKKYAIAWPSIADRLAKKKTESVERLYHVGGYPTVYVIDHNGVIRQNQLRGSALDQPLEDFIRAAEKQK